MTCADKIAEAHNWPDRLMLRDTGLHDDLGGPGQRIYTTAGRGYERVAYVRSDLADTQAQRVEEWRQDYHALEGAHRVMREANARLIAEADAQAQENARLRAENERLNKMLQPEWFYPADGYESETCRFDVYEVLEEDYFWDRAKTGQHVVKINVATSLPSIWAAVRFNCICADPDGCECDNDMIVTEHASEAEARAALGETP